MTQHEFNEEVINNLARQNTAIASAYNRIGWIITATTVNTIAIAGTIAWVVTR
jgi:hypothetical protein